MLDLWLQRILPGMARLLLLVGTGVFVGTLLENSRWLQRGGDLMRPLLRLGRLPSICAAAFVTGFFSPRAANSMLAGAYNDGNLSRSSLIVGALANTFPGVLVHVRVLAFLLIPMLGTVGLVYISIQIATAFLALLTALAIGRYCQTKLTGAEPPETLPPRQSISWAKALARAGQRTRKILIRVAAITIPLYMLVAHLEYFGVFKALAARLPAAVTQIVPPPALVVIGAHMSNIVHAAGVAAELRRSGELSAAQVLLALVVGYMLTAPLRAIRHTLPAALGIFPARLGLYIVVAGHALRLGFTLVFLVGLLILMKWNML